MVFYSILALILVAYCSLLYTTRRKSVYWWIFPAILAITPLLFKIEVMPGVYLHPSVILIGLFVLGAMLGVHQDQVRRYVSHLSFSAIRASILGGILISIGLFVYGGIVALVRQQASLTETFRALLYSLGMLTYPIGLVTGRKLTSTQNNPAGIPARLAQLMVGALAVFAVIGVGRVAYFSWNGGVVDYWQYGPQYQAIATLGQYIDGQGLHLIDSGAAESAGWLMSLGVFMAAVGARYAYRQRSFGVVAIYITAMAVLTTGVLYTLSRASLLVLVFGAAILIYTLYNTWSKRLMASLVIALAAIAVVVAFPQAPFITKSANTVSLTEEQSSAISPATKSHQSTQSGKIHQPTTKEINLEPSAAGRIDFWKKTITLYTSSASNTLFGVGLVDLKDRYDLVPHSMLLQQLVKFSLLGLGGFMYIWWLLGKACLERITTRTVSTNNMDYLSLPLIAITPGWLISNLIFGASFFSFELLVIYFGLWGIVVGLKGRYV